MAEIEASYITNMKTQSTLTSLVGTRMFEFEQASGARKPYIVAIPTTNPRGSFTQSQYGGVARLSTYIHAETVSKAREIGAALMAIYQQFNGTLGSHTVQYTEVSNARTLFGPGSEFRYLVDLVFHYT